MSRIVLYRRGSADGDGDEGGEDDDGGGPQNSLLTSPLAGGRTSASGAAGAAGKRASESGGGAETPLLSPKSPLWSAQVSGYLQQLYVAQGAPTASDPASSHVSAPLPRISGAPHSPAAKANASPQRRISSSSGGDGAGSGTSGGGGGGGNSGRNSPLHAPRPPAQSPNAGAERSASRRSRFQSVLTKVSEGRVEGTRPPLA